MITLILALYIQVVPLKGHVQTFKDPACDEDVYVLRNFQPFYVGLPCLDCPRNITWRFPDGTEGHDRIIYWQNPVSGCLSLTNDDTGESFGIEIASPASR